MGKMMYAVINFRGWKVTFDKDHVNVCRKDP